MKRFNFSFFKRGAAKIKEKIVKKAVPVVKSEFKKALIDDNKQVFKVIFTAAAAILFVVVVFGGNSETGKSIQEAGRNIYIHYYDHVVVNNYLKGV